MIKCGEMEKHRRREISQFLKSLGFVDLGAWGVLGFSWLALIRRCVSMRDLRSGDFEICVVFIAAIPNWLRSLVACELPVTPVFELLNVPQIRVPGPTQESGRMRARFFRATGRRGDGAARDASRRSGKLRDQRPVRPIQPPFSANHATVWHTTPHHTTDPGRDGVRSEFWILDFLG